MGNEERESLLNRLKRRFHHEEEAPREEEQTASEEPQQSPESVSPPQTQAEEPAPEEESAPPEREEALGEEEQPAAPDAAVRVWLAPDAMEAYVEAQHPGEGGAHVNEEQIRAEVERMGIKFGIVENAVRTIARLKLYDKGFTVARGRPAKDGKDGYVDELFPREQELRLEPDASGNVDYKNLNLIHDVEAGTPLCIIHPPELGVQGSDVFGKILEARDGKPAPVAPGRNVSLSEDGGQLVAATAGNVVFQNGQFCVEDTLRIRDNVDNAVGNIKFSGDVMIEGDVVEGYEVRAGGNVTVRGSVEGATIIAGGNIVLAKGMNGMQKGILEAGGDITCRFLENSTVHAHGAVTAESILNATVSADDKIVVRGRRGVIVGGQYTARNLIEAKTVGAMSHVPTEVVLGATPDMMQRFQEGSELCAKLADAVDLLEKDVAYLTKEAPKGHSAIERLRLLREKREELEEERLEYDAARIETEQLRAEIEESRSGRLSCMELYPPLKLSIGKQSLLVQTPERNCAFYLDGGEIKRGTMV